LYNAAHRRAFTFSPIFHEELQRTIETARVDQAVIEGSIVDSAFDDDHLVVANRSNNALEQVRCDPTYVMSAMGVPHRAHNDFVFVHAAGHEIATGKNVAAAKKFRHGIPSVGRQAR
jgi:hypothetical protein